MAKEPKGLRISKKCLECENTCKIESLGEMVYCKKFKKKSKTETKKTKK